MINKNHLSLTSKSRIYLSLQLWSKTRRKWHSTMCAVPAVSFEELGVPFQHPLIMDLRNQGILFLTSTNYGIPGVVLKRMFAELTMSEFHSLIKSLNP